MRKNLLPVLLILFFISAVSECADDENRVALLPSFTPTNVQNFLDSLVPSLMHQQNIAGCGIVIVKDSGIFLSKGYGYADLQNKRRVEPSTTLFRTASVCKVVLATALLNLRDRGLIDIHKDVNAYLRNFKVPARFNRPITVAHLLTHTPGFDDYYIGKSSRNEKEAPALGAFLQKNLPERILPPGEVLMYSNMGMALAAHLIEVVTGKDYEQYVRENIFFPLDMNRSSYRGRQEYKDDIYHGYVFLNGHQEEFPFDFINDYPAGQMLTTMNEFGHFMIMQLNGGSYKRRQVVASSTIIEMQSPQFTHHSSLHSAMGYGFFMDDYNGYKMLYHDGGYPGILTKMALFPELKLGIYIAINGYFSSLNSVLADTIMKKFYSFPDPVKTDIYPLTNLPSYDKNVDRFIGTYRFARYARNEISKVGVLLGMVGFELPIWKNDKGMLLMNDLTGKARRLIQVEPLLFRSIDDAYWIKFRADEKGNITHLFTDGTSAFEKVPLLYTLPVQRSIFILLTLFFAFIAITGIARSVKTRIGRSADKKSRMFRITEWSANLFLLYLLFYWAAARVFAKPLEQLVGMPYGVPYYYYIIQTIPFFITGLIILLIKEIVLSFYKRIITPLILWAFTLCLLPLFTLIWFLNYWNLLGYGF